MESQELNLSSCLKQPKTKNKNQIRAIPQKFSRRWISGSKGTTVLEEGEKTEWDNLQLWQSVWAAAWDREPRGPRAESLGRPRWLEFAGQSSGGQRATQSELESCRSFSWRIRQSTVSTQMWGSYLKLGKNTPKRHAYNTRNSACSHQPDKKNADLTRHWWDPQGGGLASVVGNRST